jgi:hypothetical protein
MRQTIALVVVLGGIMALALWWLIQDWSTRDITMNFHGWMALGAGTVLTLALGGGLMWLVFYSARKGYDDRIDRDEDI